MQRWLPVLLVALLMVSGRASASVPTSGVVHLRDYLTAPGDLNCTNDIAGKVQAAEQDWIAMQRAGNGGELDLGAGCYRLGSTVLIGDNSGQGVRGSVHGAGPDLTLFTTTTGIRALEFDDFWGGEIGMFSLRGPAKGTGQGIVFAARHVDLGTCCSTIHDITASNFAECFVFGDDTSPNGAAAELVVMSTKADNCTFGYHLVQYNTLDIQFMRANASHSSYGWHTSGNSGQAGQISWHGGGATGNVTDFALWGNAPFLVEGFRSENPARTTAPMVVMGSGGGQHTIIENSYFGVTVAQQSASIQSTGGVQLALYGNVLNGQVVAAGSGSVDSRQNAIHASSPFSVSAQTLLYSAADCSPAWPGTECQTWWPRL